MNRSYSRYCRHLAISLSAVFLLYLLPNVGVAQSKENAKSQTNENALEEVIVTARKREETVFQIPESLTTFGSQSINQAHMVGLEDIGIKVPNLNLVERSDGFPNVIIRGIGSFGNTQGVGFYLDDVQLYFESASRYGDMQRIEVLKGPQGTLYGGSNIGGAIKFVSKRPDPEQFGGYVSFEGGEENTRGTEAVINLPLGGSWATRLYGFADENDGFLINRDGPTFTGLDPKTRRHVDHQKEYGGRLQLQGNITDKLSAYLTVRYNYRNGGNNDYGFDLLVPDGNGGYKQGTLAFSHFRDLTINPKHLIKTTAYTAQFDYSLGSATLTSLTSYTKTDYDQTSDPDFSRDYAAEIGGHQGNNVFTQELRASSNNDSPFQWTVGAYYKNQKNPDHLNLYAYPLVLATVGVFDLPTVLYLVNSGVFAEDTVVQTSPFYSSDTTKKDLSAFASGSYRVGAVEVSGGIRIDNWRTYQTYTPTGAKGLWNKTEVMPKASLSYFFDEDRSMVYTTFSEGFEPGGFNETHFAGTPDSLFGYDAEKVQSYEVGYKGHLMNDRLQLTLAGFYSDYKDKQVELEMIDPTSQAGAFVEGILNAGDSHQKGAEAEATWLANDYLTLSLSGGYLNSEWVGGTIVNIGGSEYDISGNTPPWIPKWSWSFSGDYQYPNLISDYTFWTRVGVSYRSSFNGDLQNVTTNPSATLVNVGVGLRNEHWELSVDVKNLFDKKYYTDFQTFNAFNPLVCDAVGEAPNCPIVASALGQPRYITATLRYNF